MLGDSVVIENRLVKPVRFLPEKQDIAAGELKAPNIGRRFRRRRQQASRRGGHPGTPLTLSTGR